MAEAFLQAGLQRVIGSISNSGDQSRRRVNATAWRIVESTAGIEPPLVSVPRCRERLAGAVESGDIARRISLDETRQLCALRSDVSDFEQKIRAERVLNVQVPVLRIRQGKIGT